MAALMAQRGIRQKVHALMLEDDPTPESGAPLDISEAIALLESGQVVNCAVGPEVTAQGVRAIEAGEDSPRRIAFALARTLGVSAGLLREWNPEPHVTLSAAEVLATGPARQYVSLLLDEPVDSVLDGDSAVIDFTDVTGTYYLAGVVSSVGTTARPRVTVQVHSATLVQLRRFVRVPVLISPLCIEVQPAPGCWRELRGEIIDVSLGGLGLLVDEPVMDGVRIRLELELPGRFGILKVTGRVVPPPGPAEALVGQRRGAGLAHRRGVAFDPLWIEDLRRLQRALYYRQVELRRLADPLQTRRPAPRLMQAPAPNQSQTRWKFWARRPVNRAAGRIASGPEPS